LQRFTPINQALKALLAAQSALLTETDKTASGQDGLAQFFDSAAAAMAQISGADLVYVFKTAFSGKTSVNGDALSVVDGNSVGSTLPDEGKEQTRKTSLAIADIMLTRSATRLSLSDIARLRGSDLAANLTKLIDPQNPTTAEIIVEAIPCEGGNHSRMAALVILLSKKARAERSPDIDMAMTIAATAIGEAVSTQRRIIAKQSAAPTPSRASTVTQDWRTQAGSALDAFWEADQRGRITTLIPLSPKFEAMDRSGWIGLDLKTLQTTTPSDAPAPLEEPLRREVGFRDRAARLPGNLGRHKVSFSGAPILPEHRDGVAYYAGCLSIIGDDHGGEEERRALMELVGRLERSRDRERHLREESETLLEGLRLLTQPLPSKQIFDGLFGLLQGTLGFEGAVLVHRNWQGKLVASMASDDALEALNWKTIADNVGEGLPRQPALLSDTHTLITAINDAATHATDWRSGLLVFIELENQPAWLICLHSAKRFFDMGALGLAGRLALLTSQALAHEAERNKAIQSAKLATLGEMATGIAHEINQPLAAISLAAQNLELALEDDHLDIDYATSKVESIQAQTDRASRIVNQMRVFARKSYDQSGQFKASEQIHAALGIIGEQLRSHGIALTQNYLPEEPPVSGDALQFEQVVLNLLSNARDAIDSHRDTLTDEEHLRSFAGAISITQMAADNGYIKFRFADNGGGIPDEIIPQLFDPFFTTKPVGEGTGLGLSISYGIMRDMNGAIEASNGPDGAQIDLILAIAPPTQS